MYCAAILDAYSRRIVGWSIDSRADATLVVNALDMAFEIGDPAAGGIVHADHGSQFTSWVSGDKIRSAGLPAFTRVPGGAVATAPGAHPKLGRERVIRTVQGTVR